MEWIYDEIYLEAKSNIYKKTKGDSHENKWKSNISLHGQERTNQTKNKFFYGQSQNNRNDHLPVNS